MLRAAKNVLSPYLRCGNTRISGYKTV